jgi:hypothetical protein
VKVGLVLDAHHEPGGRTTWLAARVPPDQAEPAELDERARDVDVEFDVIGEISLAQRRHHLEEGAPLRAEIADGRR